MTNQRFEITNGTINTNQFLPALWAHNGSTNYHAIQLHATTTSTYDTGTSPLMMFIASIPTTVNLSAPSGTQFPWGNGGTQQAVNTRPTFSWINGSSTIMQLSSQNYLGLNTTSPTARLDVNGNARIRTISLTSSDPYVLTADSNGNISKQLKSTLSGGSSSNCTSTNYIPKSSSTGLTCSQIYDNGTNVSIGSSTYAPSKLTVNGDIRSLTNTFLSDKKFKKNIKTIDHALETVLKLNGTTYDWRKSEFKDIAFTDKLQYGLIAQEVEKVLPELVYKDELNGYSLNYTGLIPVLIEALKEQQNQITILSNKISELENKNENVLNTQLNKNITKISDNYPNPFEIDTKVDLFIDDKIKDAKIIVYDVNGTTVSNYQIKERGIDINFTISKSNLNSGVYFYTLITDGSVISTGKMIVK